ncbi:hypothetical protein AAW14_23905 [Streptomyces hygroscopicus]|uniref:hypothetical protein n=1 Tax=Streptomyces hygroscopicus TaxID=1912 RepID=UPI00223EC729|nr:hypothetical protein [Streptomyces hygroscopicus]MCW7944977.1 hypothetical protein [Streptomyces hygroscopicus]
MSTTRQRAGILTVAATLCLGLTLTPSAHAASASGTASATRPAAAQAACTPWHDQNTYGVTCSKGTYMAWAKCKNGRMATGALVDARSWSYAYCTKYHSSLAVPLVAGWL